MKITLLTTLEESAPLVRELQNTGHIANICNTRESAQALQGASVLMINWPYILKPDFINRQRIVLNVHNSLLPRYRGRHAFTWAILNGERELGFSLHVVVQNVDAGDVLSRTAFPLSESEDVLVAFHRGEEVLRAWLPPTVHAWVRGELQPVPQDDRQASYFRKRNDEDNWLTSFNHAFEVRNLVRAVAPPYTAGAKCRTSEGRLLRIAAATPCEGAFDNCVLGEIVESDRDSLVVACKDALLRLVIANPDVIGRLEIGERLLVGAI